MKDGGILYVSFKYGSVSKESDGRFFTDLNEDSLKNLVGNIPELSIQETTISDDVRADGGEQWFSAVLIKRGTHALKTGDEPAEVDDVEAVEGEIVIDKSGSKVLRIIKSMTDVDYMGALDRAAQYVNMANIVNTLEKGVDYIVQIPAKYQKQFETGEYFINNNKSTGIE